MTPPLDWRALAAGVTARLLRRYGLRHVDRIEDAVQTALLRALAHWPQQGPPVDPLAWLVTVANRAWLDQHRKAVRQPQELVSDPADCSPALLLSDPAQSDPVRLLAMCCHPALPMISQAALALKLVCRLPDRAIGRVLMTGEAAIAKRIFRGKNALQRLGEDRLAIEDASLAARSPMILRVIYFLFHEGFYPLEPDSESHPENQSQSQSQSRPESESVSQSSTETLREALWLAETCATHPVVGTSEALALAALLWFHTARLPARWAQPGRWVPLEEQDRSLWDRACLHRAHDWWRRATVHPEMTIYHAEACIAAEHASANTLADTNWDHILLAYDWRIRLAPQGLVYLNRVVAVAARDGPEAGWLALQQIPPEFQQPDHYLTSAVRAHLAEALRLWPEAEAGWRDAARLAPTKSETEYALARLADLGGRRAAGSVGTLGPLGPRS